MKSDVLPKLTITKAVTWDVTNVLGDLQAAVNRLNCKQPRSPNSSGTLSHIQGNTDLCPFRASAEGFQILGEVVVANFRPIS